MRYAQVAAGQKLHLVYEPGEGARPDALVPSGHLSLPLCNREFAGGYRMTINVPLSHACRNCSRVYAARHSAQANAPEGTTP
jgi:hypothetical protein